jgi:hypothetical protein
MVFKIKFSRPKNGHPSRARSYVPRAASWLKGACVICIQVLEAALEKMNFLDKMMKDCGLEYSVKGDMTIRQNHIFIGVIFVSHRG